jgi:hypothetical protein
LIRELVRQAFCEIHEGFSPDRVLTDPVLNKRFLKECHQLKLSAPHDHLNRILLNARKASFLSGIRSTRRTSFNDDDYLFASEIAIRYLERRDGVTLDDVICSPLLAAEFDALAARISPGFCPLRYRWAALKLRKTRRLRPEHVSHACPPQSILNLHIKGLRIELIPMEQGLYLFFTSRTALYAGETTNLRRRIAKHLEHSDNKGLAHWLWEFGKAALNLEIQTLPAETPSRTRKSLEAELIRSRQPLFNIRGSAIESPAIASDD